MSKGVLVTINACAHCGAAFNWPFEDAESGDCKACGKPLGHRYVDHFCRVCGQEHPAHKLGREHRERTEAEFADRVERLIGIRPVMVDITPGMLSGNPLCVLEKSPSDNPAVEIGTL